MAAAERTALLSIQTDEAQLITLTGSFTASDEAEPQPFAAAFADLNSLAIKGTTVVDDAAFRWGVLISAEGQGWVCHRRNGQQQWCHPQAHHQ